MPADDYVTRREHDQLARRVEQLDERGPRGMDVLALQVSNTASELGQLRQTVDSRFDGMARERAYAAEKAKSGRRWRVTAWISGLGAAAAILGVLIALAAEIGRLPVR